MLYLKQNTNGGLPKVILELVLQSATFIRQLGAICGALERLSSQSVSWHAGSILCHTGIVST